VNTVNPDAVIQGSGIWSSDWKAERASTYGVTEDDLQTFYRARPWQYFVLLAMKTPNLLAAVTVYWLALSFFGVTLPFTAILTFLPREGLVPNSARYVLGPESLKAFAPELIAAHSGLEEAAEAQVASYRVDKSSSRLRLALFYYPTPGMARAHAADFKQLPNVHVKRSGPLVGIIVSPATDAQADTLLSRVEYVAKITWNETPPPSPIKPLYQLLLNIIYLSLILTGICLLAGLMYAGMRIYRRRYGTLEGDEAMTTLHLAGDNPSRIP